MDAGRIPDHILEDKELTTHLPAFFRTLSGQKPSREDMEKRLFRNCLGVFHWPDQRSGD